jgi:hypothetical protein
MKAAWGNQGSLGTTYSRYAKGKGTQWKTYVDIVKLLTADMDRDKKFKERVVIQAYADAGITPKSNDVWGWVNGFGNGKSYVQIVAEHYSWKARQSGGGGTAGLSPGPVGVEALRVPNAGIVALGGGNIVAVGGGNIIALGGANIVALGGGNFQALKAIPIVALGGGNLVGFNGRGF